MHSTFDRRFKRRTAGERGAALLLVVVVIAVLTVVGFALLRMGSSENDAIASKRHQDQGLTCAEAGKELLLSKFRTYNVNPTQLTLDATIGDQEVATGHYDQLDIQTVEKASGFQQTGLGATDVSNRIPKTGLGGQVYRMTVVCKSGSGDGGVRQSEVEYMVRFGL